MGAWMIRAGRGGVYATDWLERGVIGIGWDFGGSDIAAMDREKIRAAYAAAHPSESKQEVAANIGQVYRFVHSMVQGSTVVMYDPAERLYHIGTINGPCKPTAGSDAVTYTRAVRWGKTAPRDALTTTSKNSLGGIQTIFAVSDEAMSDLEAAAEKKSVAASDDSDICEDGAANDEETLAAPTTTGLNSSKTASTNSPGRTWSVWSPACSRPRATVPASCPRVPTAVATSWPRPMR